LRRHPVGVHLVGQPPLLEKEESMGSMNNDKSRWFFLLGWVGLNALSAILAGFAAILLIELIQSVIGDTLQVAGQTHITEDFLLFYVFLPSIGLFTGFLQYLLLRRYLAHMRGWIAATFLGWLMPFAVGFLFNAILPRGLDPALWWEVPGLALVGMAIVLPQWWLLRSRIPHAAGWILAAGIGWAMIGLLNHLSTEPWAVLSAVAFLPAIATGVVCWFLMPFPETTIAAGSSAG
jgi:hypothetical protein